MKVCLVRLPAPFLLEDHLFPPLGLMAVGTSLKKQGFDVLIYDGPLDKVPVNYLYYGIGPTIAEYQDALSVKMRIKQSNPIAKVIIGGPHATTSPNKCIEDGFDCVVVGDGEMAAKEAICGSETIIEHPELPLDKYPITDRSIVDIKSYKYYIDGVLATTIMTGRGCPFNCGFCSKNHKSVRLRSSGNIIKEIDYLYHDFKYKALAFSEDLFILNKKRSEAVFRHMSRLGILSRCLVRADVVLRHGKDFVKLMADCGCYHVGMGIESGSDKILKNVNKGETVHTIKKAVRLLKNAGIKVKGFFIIGLPGESHETLDETKLFLDEMNLFDTDIKIFQPYPGSPIWNQKNKYDIGWDKQDYSAMFYKGSPGNYLGSVRTSSLSTEQIYNEWVEMENSYKWQN